MSESADRPGGFCTECGHEIDSFDGLDHCPACGTRGLPCAWRDQVNVNINWHELRILAIWAENWMRQHKLARVVYAIARRLEAQHPGRVPLTLAGELGEIAGEYRMAVSDPELRRDIAEQTGRETGLVTPEHPEESTDAP